MPLSSCGTDCHRDFFLSHRSPFVSTAFVPCLTIVVASVVISIKESIKGVDLDFYQPRSVQEHDSYVLFLKEALAAWKDDAGLKVSMTLHPHQKLPPQLYTHLDRINLMAYDMVHPQGGNAGNAYHANIDKVRRAVNDLLLQPGSGLDRAPHKILLGIPAYARHVEHPERVKAFGEIYDEVTQGDRSHAWDDFHSLEGFEWESPKRIREKVDLAREKGLGGVFLWEVGMDKFSEEFPGGMLLEAAARASRDTMTTTVNRDIDESSHDDGSRAEL